MTDEAEIEQYDPANPVHVAARRAYHQWVRSIWRRGAITGVVCYAVIDLAVDLLSRHC